MHAGFSVSSFFKNHNINTVFTLCGGHISPILVACESDGIDIVEVRDEVSAVFAADATSRLTQAIGVAIVTAGPGVTNTITAIKNAQLAQSPLILIGGAAATLLKGRGSLQDIDQMELIKPHVKSAFRITKIRDIIPQLTNALNSAISGVPGPVFIEMPIDLLYPEDSIREQHKSQIPSKGFIGKFLSWYVNRHLTDMFANKKSSIKVRKNLVKLGRQKDIDNAALAIVNAKKPVILLGNQVIQNKDALAQCLKNLKKLAIPTYTSGMSRGCFGEDDSFFMRHNRKHALKYADVVLTVGVPLDFRLGYGFSINQNAKIIAINKSKAEMIKNRKPFISIHGDPTCAISEIGKIINPPKCEKWTNELSILEEKRDEEINQQSNIKTDYINPIKLCLTINEVLDEESILIADGGDFVGTAAYTVRPKGPLSWLDPGPFGTLGVGGGFALGAKSAFKNKEVWIIYGDGACAFSLAEFDTFVRHKLPVIAIVGNDASWQQIAREQIDMLGSAIGTNLVNTAYHEVASGYGGKGYVIDSPNQVKDTLLKAKEDAKNGHPVLVNVRIGKTDFRKGSISV